MGVLTAWMTTLIVECTGLADFVEGGAYMVAASEGDSTDIANCGVGCVRVRV